MPYLLDSLSHLLVVFFLQSVVVFGQDIAQIPCFRSSFLYGISGGIASGLLYFLLTSRVKTSMDFGVASFAIVTMSYWGHCRYNYSKNKFEMEKVQELLRRRAMYEGTATDPDENPVDV